jgi:hypothetical protein
MTSKPTPAPSARAPPPPGRAPEGQTVDPPQTVEQAAAIGSACGN